MVSRTPTTLDAATARDQLPALLRRVDAGEEIILTDAHAPPARLVAMEPPEASPAKRVGGQLAGRGFWIADDFNAPLFLSSDHQTPDKPGFSR